MARMYPNRFDWKPGRDTEQQLYNAFRDKLDDSYVVFHGVAWQSLDDRRRPRDGEADFIIAHPERGILIVEAKGGLIRHDPATRSWSSTDHSGQTHSIKDPFVQARDSKYVLLDQLKMMVGDGDGRINIGHAVAFPDVLMSAAWLDPDKPRDIVLDMTDLADLSGWVGRTLAYWRGQESQRKTAPGEAVVNALMTLVGKAWELRPALWGEIVRENEQLIRLTEQQYVILDVLNRQRRAAICGCAGSGKTMLAAEKATRLARQGFRVLLTCFNRALGAELQSRLRHTSNLDVYYFHELCTTLADRAAMMLVNTGAKQFYEEQLPQVLLDAADKLNVRYDAIVVDEGQDFLDNWWIPLQNLLHDPDGGILYIFFDDNQRIFVPKGSFPIRQPPYPLTVNCRNTQSIHNQVLKFYRGDSTPSVYGPLGRPVEVLDVGDVSRILSDLSKLLQHLTRDEHIPTDEIVILTPRRQQKSLLWVGKLPGYIQLAKQWPPEPNRVYCTTIHAFKGLESAVVILAEIDRWPTKWGDLEHLLYVACSRARNYLIVLLPADAPAETRRMFT